MSFFPPDYRTFARREPRQRKGESWLSYAVRYNTWWYQTRREKTEDEIEQAVKRNAAFREAIFAARDRQIQRNIRKAKRDYFSGAVFFWFGSIGKPGHNCQYLNQSALNKLVEMIGPLEAKKRE